MTHKGISSSHQASGWTLYMMDRRSRRWGTRSVFDAGNYTYVRAARSALLWARHDQPAVVVSYNDETWGDIIECGLAMAYDVPNPANDSFRDKLEALVLATMDLTSSLTGLVCEAQMWAYVIDDIRIILLRAELASASCWC